MANTSLSLPPHVMATIDDLTYDDLTLVFRHLSVAQLYDLLSVSNKWDQLINHLLSRQKSLTLHYNDINYYTNEELAQKCHTLRHLAINSSVGRVLATRQTQLSLFTTLPFRVIQEDLNQFMINWCPNIQSLDITQYSISVTDLDQLITHCPQLQCLYVTSHERKWTLFLNTKVAGLKHFSINLRTGTPMYGSSGRSIGPGDFDGQNPSLAVANIEDLTIMRPRVDHLSLDLFGRYLQSFGSQLKKFNFLPETKLIDSYCLNLIHALTLTSKTTLKNLNINTFVFKQLFKEISDNLPNIETLYLHLHNESQSNGSLKRLEHLKQVYLNLNANNSELAFDEPEYDNDIQYQTVLSKLPETLESLTILDANLTMVSLAQTITLLPHLRELQLIDVYLDSDDQQNFWLFISNYNSLVSLTLNQSYISDAGFEHLVGSQSLTTLELVKYKGPDANQTLIDSFKVIELFGQLATVRPKQWFHLRLDIDVFEVDHHIRAQIPRNLKLVNIGFKK